MMATGPYGQPIETITPLEGGPEYDAFIQKVQHFYAQRGTPFDPQPKIGNRPVDLLRLYKRVVGLGGYDVVSDTKSNKLAWRTIGQEFNLGTTNLPALAFNLKTVYYRFLAAFEIVDIHKKIPPPREIFEDVSAKGANVLGRTLENYVKPIPRDAKNPEAGGEDGDDDDAGTPSKMDIDEPGGSRGGRNLRHAPPQRVLFQNDMSTTRQTRNQAIMGASPTPTSSYPYGVSNGISAYASNQPQTLANYEPKQQIPLTLRPVNTPANNPEAFKALELARRDRILAKYTGASSMPKGMMLPGTGFTGPSIYIRTLFSLQSGVLEEQEYALHHLVKISHERGDKYRFDGFSGLAEALIEKVLDISSLLGGPSFQVTYDYHHSATDHEQIDGLNGTPNILSKAKTISTIKLQDQLETPAFSRRLCLVAEAALVIRNMVMLDENADFISKYPAMRDLIVLLLHLPHHSLLDEIRYYGLDLAEQLSKYFAADVSEPLYEALLSLIDDTDRAAVLTSLHSLSRMGTQLPNLTPLQSIPVTTILQVCDWLLVEDYELRTACLDLLYRYTAAMDNVEELLKHLDIEVLIGRIVRLLLSGAKVTGNKVVEETKMVTRLAPPSADEARIPKIPAELTEQLIVYDEPQRSSEWLRSCFEEDPTGEITQIALWQAYQIPFAPFAATRPLLPAKDFITNVSSTFARASAQVMNGVTPRFVIRGIRARAVPVDLQGRVYSHCLWHVDGEAECGEFAAHGKSMWEHIVSAHLGLTKDETGQYILDLADTAVHNCCWAGCTRFDGVAAASAFIVGMHVKTHMSDVSSTSTERAKYNITSDQEPITKTADKAWTMHNTMTDERFDAIGLPLTSALVLRNLARMLPKTSAGLKNNGEVNENVLWEYFGNVKDQLFYVMAHNQPLREWLAPLGQRLTGDF